MALLCSVCYPHGGVPEWHYYALYVIPPYAHLVTRFKAILLEKFKLNLQPSCNQI